MPDRPDPDFVRFGFGCWNLVDRAKMGHGKSLIRKSLAEDTEGFVKGDE